MPNLGFHLEVLRKAVTERAAQRDALAASIAQDASLMRFAVLGALGPDMLRYMPVSPPLSDFLFNLIPSATSGTNFGPLQVVQLQTDAGNALLTLTGQAPGQTQPPTPQQLGLALEIFLNPLGAAYSVLFRSLVVPVWPKLFDINSVLNQLDTIVTNHDHQGLLDLLGSLQNLQNQHQQLAGLSGTIPVLSTVIGAFFALGPFMEVNLQIGLPPADPIADRQYEFLRWHHTGEFVRNLLKRAQSDNDPEEEAFVFGWQCHVASSVTAEPFINNIVGGPYRTHWQRNRLVGNFVDAWTFGFFEQPTAPTFVSDNPTPPYFDPQTGKSWPSICTANLQDHFDVAQFGDAPQGEVHDAVNAMANGISWPPSGLAKKLTDQFPKKISTLLQEALAATYTQPLGSTVFPDATLPIVGIDGSPAFAPGTFEKAFVGAFAVYWFMTSGFAVTAENPTGTPTGQPEPSWIVSGSTPSAAQAGFELGATICDLILAWFGALFTFGASLVTFVPSIDWSTVANESFWIRKILADQENLLRDILVWTGLGYPPPVLLGVIDPNGTTLPVTDLTNFTNPQIPSPTPSGNVPTTSGAYLCKTNGFTVELRDSYPRRLDLTVQGRADLNFDSFPISVGPELPTTDNANPPAASNPASSAPITPQHEP